jgi:hypothetical protein
MPREAFFANGTNQAAVTTPEETEDEERSGEYVYLNASLQSLTAVSFAHRLPKIAPSLS